MKQITVNYKQDIQELIIQFYGLLAKKDIHILCFGSYLIYNTLCKASYNNSIEDNGIWESELNLPVQKFNLPSWTGVYGEHDAYNVHKTTFKNYTVSGRILKLTCSGITNKQDCTEFSTLQSIENILPPFPQQNLNDSDNWRLVIRIQSQGSMNEKLIGFYDIHKTYRDSVPYGDIIERLQELSHFMSIKTLNLEWILDSSELSIPTFTFDVVEEILEGSGQYVLLTGIPFEAPDVSHVKYPVIKKEGDYYKAIGMCNLFSDSHFFDDFTMEEQTFQIH
ncbi:hypothetical protein BDC45DRAFT_516559 [Circinella umbellata]|nr:hypothetical protein BDC45DRAFT_516559 [Circinella umbellata]